MKKPSANERLAGAFWDRVGRRPDPPRDLESLAPLVCDVFFRTVSDLTPTHVREWLHRQGLIVPAKPDARSLLGCVVAFRGRAAIFLRDDLDPAERRMIAAHEFAHYLAEYLTPRERILRRLGESVLPVLDGDRPPTDAEMWAGALAGVRLGLHAHYLDRDPECEWIGAERTANDQALELLAPREMVLANGGDLESALIHRFGLPPAWATGYARRLSEERRRVEPLSKAWRL